MFREQYNINLIKLIILINNLLACWMDNPDERPNIHEVVSSLKEIITEESNDSS